MIDLLTSTDVRNWQYISLTGALSGISKTRALAVHKAKCVSWLPDMFRHIQTMEEHTLLAILECVMQTSSVQSYVQKHRCRRQRKASHTEVPDKLTHTLLCGWSNHEPNLRSFRAPVHRSVVPGPSSNIQSAHAQSALNLQLRNSKRLFCSPHTMYVPALGGLLQQPNHPFSHDPHNPSSKPWSMPNAAEPPNSKLCKIASCSLPELSKCGLYGAVAAA